MGIVSSETDVLLEPNDLMDLVANEPRASQSRFLKDVYLDK